ncbi:hypothetical protein J2X36_004617 [Methylobacterium sp. BE186]|nr:hypothetical protein [Methylobacterium sp. BE186]
MERTAAGLSSLADATEALRRLASSDRRHVVATNRLKLTVERRDRCALGSQAAFADEAARIIKDALPSRFPCPNRHAPTALVAVSPGLDATADKPKAHFVAEVPRIDPQPRSKLLRVNHPVPVCVFLEVHALALHGTGGRYQLSRLLRSLGQHVPLGLTNDRGWITPSLMRQQEQIGNQINDLAGEHTVRQAPLCTLGRDVGIKGSLRELRTADFHRHEQAPRNSGLPGHAIRRLIRRKATLVDQAPLFVEHAPPSCLTTSNRNARSPFVPAVPCLNPSVHETEVHLVSQQPQCDAELGRKLVWICDPLAACVALEAHWAALHQLGRRSGLRLSVAQTEKSRDHCAPDRARTAVISNEANDGVDEMHRAERKPDALLRSAAVLHRLAPIDHRHVLANFAALHQHA